MNMTTEQFCTNLENVSRVEMIRAIHEAFLQIKSEAENKDNGPVLLNLEKCLHAAGYIESRHWMEHREIWPSHWASFLINRDGSGLDPDECDEIESLIDENGGFFPVSCHDHGICDFKGKLTECSVYLFLSNS